VSTNNAKRVDSATGLNDISVGGNQASGTAPGSFSTVCLYTGEACTYSLEQG